MRSPAPGASVIDLLRFIDASPSPYHAVHEASERLKSAGFRQLAEHLPWTLGPGERGFLVRGGGSLLAFIAGTRPPSEAGFLILGAHTDSPNFRIKPCPDIKGRGLRQLGVEVYGGVLLHSWLDRDLSIAGRITDALGTTHHFRLERPLCRIANLAIHLNPTLATNGLQLNAQQHLIPTHGLIYDNAPGFNAFLSTELAAQGIATLNPEQILGFDLCLYDTQPSAVGGSDRELMFASRLDNLASCHAALTALLSEGEQTEHTRVIVLYDHEEVGSQSATGARSQFLPSVLARIVRAYAATGIDAEACALARSLLVSVDMAHAVHPNYADRHDPQHMPKLGAGPIIKVNASQSYATDGPATAMFEAICRACDVPTQRFVSRNDMRCGSTIGPISAAQTGMRTIDVGNPMLSMHSCREMACTGDVEPMIRALSQLLINGKVPPSAN